MSKGYHHLALTPDQLASMVGQSLDVLPLNVALVTLAKIVLNAPGFAGRTREAATLLDATLVTADCPADQRAMTSAAVALMDAADAVLAAGIAASVADIEAHANRRSRP